MERTIEMNLEGASRTRECVRRKMRINAPAQLGSLFLASVELRMSLCGVKRC